MGQRATKTRGSQRPEKGSFVKKPREDLLRNPDRIHIEDDLIQEVSVEYNPVVEDYPVQDDLGEFVSIPPARPPQDSRLGPRPPRNAISENDNSSQYSSTSGNHVKSRSPSHKLNHNQLAQNDNVKVTPRDKHSVTPREDILPGGALEREPTKCTIVIRLEPELDSDSEEGESENENEYSLNEEDEAKEVTILDDENLITGLKKDENDLTGEEEANGSAGEEADEDEEEEEEEEVEEEEDDDQSMCSTIQEVDEDDQSVVLEREVEGEAEPTELLTEGKVIDKETEQLTEGKVIDNEAENQTKPVELNQEVEDKVEEQIQNNAESSQSDNVDTSLNEPEKSETTDLIEIPITPVNRSDSRTSQFIGIASQPSRNSNENNELTPTRSNSHVSLSLDLEALSTEPVPSASAMNTSRSMAEDNGGIITVARLSRNSTRSVPHANIPDSQRSNNHDTHRSKDSHQSKTSRRSIPLDDVIRLMTEKSCDKIYPDVEPDDLDFLERNRVKKPTKAYYTGKALDTIYGDNLLRMCRQDHEQNLEPNNKPDPQATTKRIVRFSESSSPQEVLSSQSHRNNEPKGSEKVAPHRHSVPNTTSTSTRVMNRDQVIHTPMTGTITRSHTFCAPNATVKKKPNPRRFQNTGFLGQTLSGDLFSYDSFVHKNNYGHAKQRSRMNQNGSNQGSHQGLQKKVKPYVPYSSFR